MDQNPLNCKTAAIFPEVDGILFMCTLSPGLQYDFGSFLRNGSCCEGIPDNLHARRVSFL